MSLRAFIIGLIGATFLCGYAFYNDIVLHQTVMVGTHFPLSVYGSLIVFLFLVNPLLGALSRGRKNKKGFFRPFTGREMCLIMALVLPACCMATSSFMRLLPRAMCPVREWRFPHNQATEHLDSQGIPAV